VTTSAETDAILLRMQRIRNRMHVKAEVLRVDAQSFFDWRSYIERYPWSCVAAAAVIGFWLMPGPRVMPTVKLAEDSMDELVRREAQRIQPARRIPPWLASLGGLGFRLGANALMSHLAQRMEPTRRTQPAPRETHA
jgi:hypothetical protein